MQKSTNYNKNRVLALTLSNENKNSIHVFSNYVQTSDLIITLSRNINFKFSHKTNVFAPKVTLFLANFFHLSPFAATRPFERQVPKKRSKRRATDCRRWMIKRGAAFQGSRWKNRRRNAAKRKSTRRKRRMHLFHATRVASSSVWSCSINARWIAGRFFVVDPAKNRAKKSVSVGRLPG